MEDSRRCKAHKSDGSGERCSKPAMLGQSVCRAHGGASPQAKKSARERLEALVDPAINTLRTVIKTGLKTGDTTSAVRASLGILDRTGFHPSQGIELNGKNGGSVQLNQTDNVLYEFATLEEKKMVVEIIERAMERRERGEKPDIEGEIIARLADEWD